jgi:hypothetical protein
MFAKTLLRFRERHSLTISLHRTVAQSALAAGDIRCGTAHRPRATAWRHAELTGESMIWISVKQPGDSRRPTCRLTVKKWSKLYR